MSDQSEHEVQQLVSHITNGESNLDQLRQALGEPLLTRWHLETYRDIPTTNQGRTLFGWAVQNKNKAALELLMQNFGLKFLPEEPRMEVRPAERPSLLQIAVEHYHQPTWTFVLQHIDDIKRAFEQIGRSKTTTLHAAAKRNNAEVFRALHEKIGSTLKDKLLETRDGQKQTVLHVAASGVTYNEDASQRCYDTVVELLKIQPELIKSQDEHGETVFHKAVLAKKKQVLQYLLTVDATILSKCDKNEDSAYIFFQKERGKRDHMQNVFRNDAESFKLPRTLTFDEEIGLILRKAILGLDKLNISTRRQLLFKDEPGGVGPELKWDLSAFDEKGLNLDFAEYLQVLESNKFNTNFYETLIQVVLPDLNCTGSRSCEATIQGLRMSSEANVIFNHLKSKGVKHIVEAVVPDCMAHPHVNRNIISALRDFNIRCLKWRKLDLGVKTIAMAAPEVEVLTLYSSGDRDALSHWVAVDGLCQLPKLHTIHIIIFRGQEDDADLQETRRQCEDGLLGHREHSQHDRRLRMVRKHGVWEIENLPCDCQMPRFSRSQIKVEIEPVPVANPISDEQSPPHHQYHPSQGTILDKLLPLRRFTSGFKAGSRADIDYLTMNPVKVAILDSGIYADSSLFPALTGASFIEDMSTKDSHWHTVTNPHGTSMASLIRKIDPTCHIYAARTHRGPDMKGGDVNATIKALDWAMSHKVDVICISWTCPDNLEDDNDDFGNLESKIQDAAQNSLIFCATGDKGPSAKKSYPAGFKTTFKISNCSINGLPSKDAEVQNTEFYVPAEDLATAVPGYLKRGKIETAGGSSAATAIAAGLASLVLSLARLVYYRLEDGSSEPRTDDYDNSEIRIECIERSESMFKRLKRRSIMERVFEHMCCSSGKFVQPWEVFPTDLVGLDFERAKELLTDFLESASRR